MLARIVADEGSPVVAAAPASTPARRIDQLATLLVGVDAPEAPVRALGDIDALGIALQNLVANADRYATPLRDRKAARAAVNWYRGLPLSRALFHRLNKLCSLA